MSPAPKPTETREDPLLKKLKTNIHTIAERYFVDPSDHHGVPHAAVSFLSLGYALGTNTLLLGEPGFGKTTSAKTILAALTGLPYDLYEALQIEGHPEQTRGEMIGRPDFHKLTTEGEVTIWNLAAYLPGILIDEINRLPEGKQDILLTCVDTGRFNSSLGHTLYTGKRPFFATANYKDQNNHLMTAPLLDRFHFSLELRSLGPLHREHIAATIKNRQRELCNPDLVTRILDELQDKKLRDKEKLDKITTYQKDFTKRLQTYGLSPFTNSELEELRTTIEQTPLATEALLFLDCLEAEMNYSHLYGHKRRSDPPTFSTHEKKLATSKIKNPLSPRATLALETYAKALAYLQAHKEVNKDDILPLAPYVLAHRLEPTQDFQAQHAEKQRETQGSENHELAWQLTKSVEANFKDVYTYISLLQTYADEKARKDLTLEQQRQAKELLTNSDKIEHPLIHQYATYLKTITKA